MFTWICPKCQSEVPPSYNECPNCAAAEAAKAAPAIEAEPEPAPPPPQSTAFARMHAVPPTPQPAIPVAPAPVVSAPPPPPAPIARQGIPAWILMAGTIAGIAVVLGVLYLWVLPSRRGDAQASGSKAALENVTQSKNLTPNHPMAKHLELTGFRVTEDNKRRMQVQFLVINHSGADLPLLKMDVTLKAADRALVDFPFTLPSIGPYESKEATVNVKTDLRPYELPDWQALRAEFRITSPQ